MSFLFYYYCSTEEDERKKLKPKSPNLNPFYVNPTQLDPFLDPEGQPDPFESQNYAQHWVESKKTTGLAAIVHST